MNDVVFALAGAQRPWLNWVPMPTEAVCNLANELGGRRARGEQVGMCRRHRSANCP
jgi:hypothetical protein